MARYDLNMGLDLYKVDVDYLLQTLSTLNPNHPFFGKGFKPDRTPKRQANAIMSDAGSNYISSTTGSSGNKRTFRMKDFASKVGEEFFIGLPESASNKRTIKLEANDQTSMTTPEVSKLRNQMDKLDISSELPYEEDQGSCKGKGVTLRSAINGREIKVTKLEGYETPMVKPF